MTSWQIPTDERRKYTRAEAIELLTLLQESQYDMKEDMTGETCETCGKGEYKETSVQDDMHGDLHCTNCGVRVDRYQSEYETYDFDSMDNAELEEELCLSGVVHDDDMLGVIP